MEVTDVEKDLEPEPSLSKSIDTESMWECLPSQVFRKLFTLMGCSSVKTLRQVCSAWKEEMETDVGLIIKIDTRIPDNKEFIKKIAVLEARVLNLDDPIEEQLFLFPGSLIRLILAGKVSPSWFRSQISAFVNLTKLILRGGFLTNCDLQNLPETTNDVSLSAPPTCGQYIIMSSLKSLEIISNEFAYNEFFLPLAIRLRDPLRVRETEQNFIQMSLRVANNISFLLMSIRSPELKMLQLYSYQKPGVLLPEPQNWRFHPLETFLECHKPTLKELYLPEFEGKHHLGHQERGVPTQLSKLSVEICSFIGDRDQGRLQDTNYWKNLISSQTALKAVDLQITDMSQDWLTEVISSMCRNSKQTLTFIDLTFQMEENFEMSCTVFNECTCLKVLRLTCRENEAFITNFTSLPVSLKKIRMTSCFILVPNPEEIKKFNNLIMLELSTFMLDGGIHSQSLLVMRELLRLRTMNYLSVSFNENAGNNESLRVILEHFSLFWDPRFRFSGFKVNYGYELQEGWSDEYFDETETDRDFINQREPENLPSWGTSFSNVEDDPRVILFHNIPLLVRTIALHDRNHQGDDDDGDDDDDDDLDDGRSFHSDDDEEDADFF